MAMARTLVETVRGIYEVWARGDFRPAVEAYDPHIVVVTRPDLPDGGRYVGVEAISAYMREYLAPFEHITWTAEELIEADGSVVAVTRQRGTAKRSGLSVEGQLFIVWTFRGRAVIRMEFFADRAGALEAVGLSAAPDKENAAAVRRFIDQARDDPDAVWGIFDESVEWELAGAVTAPDLAQTWHGPDAVREFFRRWTGAFDEWDYEVEELIERSDTVAVRIHQWGRGKGSGVPVDSRFWQVWTMRDGKAVRVTHREELGG